MNKTLAFIMILVFSTLTQAKPQIEIADAWVKEVPPVSRVSVLFMKIINKGNTDDKLISVKTDIAKYAELHKMVMEGGIMKMRKIDQLTVPARGEVALEPGGVHIMLIGLQKIPQKGDKVKVELIFERSGKTTIEVPVRPPTPR